MRIAPHPPPEKTYVSPYALQASATQGLQSFNNLPNYGKDDHRINSAGGQPPTERGSSSYYPNVPPFLAKHIKGPDQRSIQWVPKVPPGGTFPHSYGPLDYSRPDIGPWRFYKEPSGRTRGSAATPDTDKEGR